MSDGGLRQLFQEHLPDFFWQSIETWSTGRGVPDLYYCARADKRTRYCSGWIECKKADANAVEVRPEQVGWAERLLRHNGRVWFAVRLKCAAGKRRSARDELHIFHGEGARYLKTGGISAVPSLFKKGEWAGGPAKWDWSAIRAVLLT